VSAAGRAPVAAVLAVAGLALAACGEDRSASVSTETEAPPTTAAAPSPAPEPPAAKVTVAESDYRLEPARIRVDRPTDLEVTVKNTGAERHALVVEGPSGRAATERLAPGDETVLRVELDRPGRYRWYCPVADHDRRGMRGSIRVSRP
jgi:plastocyanin